MHKPVLITEGQASQWFDTLEQAMAAGRDRHRAGETVHIELMSHATGQAMGYRYEASSDEWLLVQLPQGARAITQDSKAAA